MTEISTTDALGELIALGKKSVKVRRIILEFLDQMPVLGGQEIVTSLSGKRLMRDKPSDQLLGCLAAAYTVT